MNSQAAFSFFLCYDERFLRVVRKLRHIEF